MLTVRGVNLVGYSSQAFLLAEAGLEHSIQRAAALGCNWIAVNFWWFQHHPGAAEVAPDETRYTITNEAIEIAIQTAHGRGLQVLLRPMLDVREGGWRGEIRPSRPWFESYRNFILGYAAQAATWGVAALSVGAELSAAERWEPEWRRLVEDARGVYPGLIVYSAQHDAALRLRWWDAVDVIGIDEYSQVARGPEASAASMLQAWSRRLDWIEHKVVRRFAGRPVWLTELGVRSARGAAIKPWCWEGKFADGSAVDVEEQANYYEAALLAAESRAWLEGAFWWCWHPDPAAAYVTGTDYSPQGKPAEEVLARHWSHA